ncbi:hypothetical protein OIU84_012456 [Salix udensis]|uniref:Uncharacterized protein n=1 Tax=Salix udensis TaxID=889485 RepID=A0AAD6NSW2_9ROSI|nr:hypothetical protein OIU84_012456 [Salix udensis]
MDQNHNESHSYNNLIMNKSSSWLEVRLFYVRITPCVIESVPGHLTLRHLGRSISTPLEINGSKIPAADSASLNLRRDRLSKESSEVTPFWVSPRKKASRYAILDAIPEDEELDNRRQNGVISNGLVRQRKVQGGAVVSVVGFCLTAFCSSLI